MTDQEQSQSTALANARAQFEAQKEYADKQFKRDAKMKALEKAPANVSVEAYLEEASKIYEWIIAE